ncbi:MAG: c-type cytochrome [Planctomycetes bacterium]|nr:c-type cytochrome [Planctomycetota bacterium]
MKTKAIAVLAGAVALAGLLFAWRSCEPEDQQRNDSQPVDPIPSQEDLSLLGADLFQRECAPCHGEAGRGDGPAARYLDPRPRNFTRRRFKIVSTRSGSLPTDRDLLETLRRGLPGSAMPAFVYLSDREREALVLHVKSLAVFEVDGETVRPFETWDRTPFEVSQEPPRTEQSIARGKEVYEKVECAKCHGDRGLGDGPSAATLVDEEEHAIRAANLTLGVYKGGDESRDLYLRLMCGMPGSPMPSFQATFEKEEDCWALVHYMQSLRGPDAPWRPDAPEESAVARGWRLFNEMGCRSCHGAGGRGGVTNPNYIKDTVPPLHTLADRMMLFDREDVEEIVRILEQGSSLHSLEDDPPVPRFNAALAQYDAIREVIQNGITAGRKDPEGIAPPINMPSWRHLLSDADVDAIIAWLLTQQPWEDENG